MVERRNSGVGLHKRSSQKPLTSGGASDAQEDFETTRSATGPLVMQRGVSQLLFHYLPARTVDWENGLAIVMLTQEFLYVQSVEHERSGNSDRSLSTVVVRLSQ